MKSIERLQDSFLGAYGNSQYLELYAVKFIGLPRIKELNGHEPFLLFLIIDVGLDLLARARPNRGHDSFDFMVIIDNYNRSGMVRPQTQSQSQR